MKRIISVVVSIILLLNMSLAYTTQIKINGGGIIMTSEEGNNVRIIPKVGIEGWVVEEGEVELNEEANSVASFTMPSENVAISNLILGVNSPNTLAAEDTWYTKGGTNIAKSSITSINIEDSYTPLTTPVASWDASAMDDGTVMVYIEDDGLEGDTYKLTIVGDGTGKIYANANSSHAFEEFSNVTSISGLKDGSGNAVFDTSEVTNMHAMFNDCSTLVDLDVSSFDTSKVINMREMFYECNSLVSIDVSRFNTNQVTDMSGMFGGCSELENLNVSGFNTSKVTVMAGMFGSCSSLTSLNLSTFDTSKVINMQAMFSNCSNLTSLNVSNFDTSNVTTMISMFVYCSSLTGLNVSNFDTSKVTDMKYMFHGCYNLASIDVSEFNTNQVTDMSYMFYACMSLTNIDVNEFDTSKVTDMSYMFSECDDLVSLDISNFDTRSITSSGRNLVENGDDDYYTYYGLARIVCGCENLAQITLGDNFGQSNNISTPGEEIGMFYVSGNVNTTITGANALMTNYAWGADNRTVTFN